jgi:TctA family transporter
VFLVLQFYVVLTNKKQPAMKKLITLYLSFFVGIMILSQEKTTETAIEDVITTFFEGLHQGDSVMVQKTIHKEAKIQTTFTNKIGEKVLKTEARTALLKAIANKNPAHIT